MALINLERFVSAIFSRSAFYDYLKNSPNLLILLSSLFGTSQFLSDTLIRNPEYLDWITSGAVLEKQKSKDDFVGELTQTLKLFPKKESRMGVLRRFKRREMLRIGIRDILGQASLEITVRELSALADGLMQAALDMAWEEMGAKYGVPMEGSGSPAWPARFAVIGMGKLGGEELNYSSDIDVMFLYSDEGKVRSPKGKETGMTTHEFFNRVAEQAIQWLASTTNEGYVFRVDARLRPEGETGPLARSLPSYETYYATWGEAWEKLALIKARPIAGDKTLGEEFFSMVRPFVYQRHLGASAIGDILGIKRRMEARLSTQGKTFTEVKLGYGGIREIEFSIQLLQLIYGARIPAIQNRNSLETLRLLAATRLVPKNTANILDKAYRFLRRVEHFLQIVHEMQVHELPTDPLEREKLAQRLGYRDRGKDKASTFFDRDYVRYAKHVHGFHKAIFGKEQAILQEREDLGFLFQKDQVARAAKHLAGQGFKDPEKARTILSLLANGPSYMHLTSATVREFIHLTPALLALLRDVPDPDAALNELERMVNVQGARTGFYKLLASQEKLLKMLVTIAGFCPDLSETLVRHPEFLEVLTTQDSLNTPKGSKEMQEALTAEGADLGKDTLNRFRQYETLRIGVRDLLGLGDIRIIMSELSDLADAIVGKALERIGGTRLPFPYAVMALGKLGSREMGFYSDLDLLFVYDGDESQSEPYQKLSQRLIGYLMEKTADGQLYKADARLRPGGKSDVIALPLEGYRQYYEQKLQTWERLALTRLRFMAGDAPLGNRFMQMCDGFLYSRALNSVQIQEAHAMRQRMTQEKIPLDQKDRHVKLDPGGLADVEFAAQILQLKWGWKYTALRRGGVFDVLREARSLRVLQGKDADTLISGYTFGRSLENKIRMLAGLPQENIPSDTENQYRLAKAMGFKEKSPSQSVAAFWAKYERCKKSVHAVFEKICRA